MKLWFPVTSVTENHTILSRTDPLHIVQGGPRGEQGSEHAGCWTLWWSHESIFIIHPVTLRKNPATCWVWRTSVFLLSDVMKQSSFFSVTWIILSPSVSWTLYEPWSQFAAFLWTCLSFQLFVTFTDVKLISSLSLCFPRRGWKTFYRFWTHAEVYMIWRVLLCLFFTLLSDPL